MADVDFASLIKPDAKVIIVHGWDRSTRVAGYLRQTWLFGSGPPMDCGSLFDEPSHVVLAVPTGTMTTPIKAKIVVSRSFLMTQSGTRKP
jgi:hypothetical protein